MLPSDERGIMNMKKSEARMTFIFITILLDAIGIGLVVPILPEVIRRFGTDEAFVSTFYGYFISLYSSILLLLLFNTSLSKFSLH